MATRTFQKILILITSVVIILIRRLACWGTWAQQIAKKLIYWQQVFISSSNF